MSKSHTGDLNGVGAFVSYRFGMQIHFHVKDLFFLHY